MPRLVGLTLHQQVVEEVPVAEHDFVVDLVVHEYSER